MIARIWKGATRTSDSAAYARYMVDVALPGYRQVAGNRGALMLRRERDDGRTEFTMVTLWEDMAAIRAFAGDQPDRAVFYPDDDRFLVERDLAVTHHEVYAAEL
jgi:heme-degrading monooxygenase HmoA